MRYILYIFILTKVFSTVYSEVQPENAEESVECVKFDTPLLINNSALEKGILRNNGHELELRSEILNSRTYATGGILGDKIYYLDRIIYRWLKITAEMYLLYEAILYYERALVENYFVVIVPILVIDQPSTKDDYHPYPVNALRHVIMPSTQVEVRLFDGFGYFYTKESAPNTYDLYNGNYLQTDDRRIGNATVAIVPFNASRYITKDYFDHFLKLKGTDGKDIGYGYPTLPTIPPDGCGDGIEKAVLLDVSAETPQDRRA